MLLEIMVIIMMGYVLGSINAGYLLGKLIKKVDIRDSGSQNAGASNATIVLGWKFGILTAVIDILKGTLAVFLVKYLFNAPDMYLFIAGLAVVLGHNYPFYMNFKGGKGTASVIGMFIAIDIKLALIMAAAIIIITIITDYIVIGTAVMYVVSSAYIYIYFSIVCFIIILFLTILSMYKHRSNFAKILRKEETGLSKLLKRKKT
jgi:acyl phosphate:glycerol-3-phosphate acyltransferase